MVSKAEQGRIKTMTDSQLTGAVVATASTLGQRLSSAQRTRTIEYKRALVTEWRNRHGDAPMFN